MRIEDSLGFRIVGRAHAELDEMIQYCVNEVPFEACGLLSGPSADGIVTDVWPIRNVHGRPEHAFAMDPTEQIIIWNHLEGRGHVVLGYYHSHPNEGAGPSPQDYAFAESVPDQVMVIVSLAEAMPVVKCWQHGRLIDRQLFA